MAPLDGVRAKLDRADELLNQLKTEAQQHVTASNYHIMVEKQPQHRAHVLKAVGPDIPLRLSVIAGEVVHHFRSSLDHVLRELVVANGQPPSRDHQFPITSSQKGYADARKRGRIKGVSTAAEKLILQEQPFQRGAEYGTHMLWALQEMDNSNKHNLLVIAAAMSTFQELGVDGGDRNISIIGMSPPRGPVRPTLDGTEMFTVFFGDDYHDGIELRPVQIFEVAFVRVGQIIGVPVIETLSKARMYIRDLVRQFADVL